MSKGDQYVEFYTVVDMQIHIANLELRVLPFGKT